MSPMSEKFLKMDTQFAEGGKGGGPMFASSRSETQTIVPPQPEQTTEGPQFSKSTHEPQGIVHRLKNIVSKDNMVSTLMTLGFIKGWADKTAGAWGVSTPQLKIPKPSFLPEIPGSGAVNSLLYGKGFDKSQLRFDGGNKPKTGLEKAMAVSVTSALVQNLAFFMTKRGGEFPKGDTMLEKTINSLKHPDKHSVHFSTATISGILGVMSATRLAMGVQGLKAHPEDFKKNASSIVAGIAGLICSPMIFAGMFKMKDASAEEKPAGDAAEGEEPKELKSFAEEKDTQKGGNFIKSFSPKHLKDMAAYAMKNDRMGLIGRGLSLVMELGFVVDGQLALKKDPTNGAAYKTIQGGLTGVALSVLQSHFVYDKLLTASRQSEASR